MTMPVLKQVEWGPVLIRSHRLGGVFDLPLTQQYMMKTRYVPFGSIPGIEQRALAVAR